MTEPENSEAKSGLFTAIVHFHGMGSQRRLEETARMIDALDRFQFTEHKAGRGLGLLRGIQPRLIPNEIRGNEPHAYIRASLVSADNAPSRDVRFYEAYWAPVMADEKSALSIALWIVGQWRRPLQNLFTPWRQRQRLRRASLIAQFEHFRSSVPTNVDTDLESLIDLYNDFESPQARRGIFNGRGPSNGSFYDFLAYIDFKNPPKKERSEPGRSNRLKGVANAWRRHYIVSELQVLFLLSTVILAVALAAAAVLIGAFGVANALLSFTRAVPSLARFTPLLGEGSTIALLLATGVTSLVGITGFLTDALGDVRAWASYRETDLGNRKRQEILATARETLSRVLSDPKCGRVVITAHSLGTTIAHDTLLSLTRINRAKNSEDPIEVRCRSKRSNTSSRGAARSTRSSISSRVRRPRRTDTFGCRKSYVATPAGRRSPITVSRTSTG